MKLVFQNYILFSGNYQMTGLKEVFRLDDTSITVDNVTIKWLGHAGFMIKGAEINVYVDPYVLSTGIIDFEDQADILLITHEHFDHCNPESIRKVRKSYATTLIPENVTLDFKGDARRIRDGDMLRDHLSIKDVNIEVLPAYNIDKQYHPKGIGVGYLIEVGGLRIYHTGDTDFIPEMNDVSADVVLVPIGGTYTMDEYEAADAVASISPKIAIPMHYNYVEGTEGDPEKFKQLVNENNPDVDVVILNFEQ
jgi:L-ascorbate metabolism protein UlaG (beta-lactamase superfamily)